MTETCNDLQAINLPDTEAVNSEVDGEIFAASTK